MTTRFAEGLPDVNDPDEFVVYPRRADWRYRGTPMSTAVTDTERQTPLYAPSEHMYGEYVDRDDYAALYKMRPRSESPFRGVDRVKLIMSLLTFPTRDGGAGLPLDKLVAKQVVLAAFPLHATDELHTLEARWLRYWSPPWRQPLQRIVDYYGEKIGFYFLFLGHYATYFMVAALAGVAVFLDTLISPLHENAKSVPAFCVFMSLWATVFVQTWKRKQARHAMLWGTIGFEADESDRPEFAEDPSTELIHSPVDGEPTSYYPPEIRRRRSYVSGATIAVCAVGSMAVVYCIFLLNVAVRYPKTERRIDPHSWWHLLPTQEMRPQIIGVANTLQILVMEAAYRSIAQALNDAEGHRTDTAYEDALIAKTFIFTFVNAYASFFYTAFLKRVQAEVPGAGFGFNRSQRLFECDRTADGQQSCMADLHKQLSSIFV